jgi:hypothetical protein
MSKPSVPIRVQQIRDECSTLATVQWDSIAKRLEEMYYRDREGSTIPDGRPTQTLSTDIPAADPEALTPTERAANQHLFAGTGSTRTQDKTGRLEADPLHDAYVRARAALGQAALAVDTLVDNLLAAKEAQTYQKPMGHTTTKCCEPGCEDMAEKAGRCNADYMRKYRYEKDNPGQTCPPLTAEELAKRNPPKRMKAG